MCEVAGIERQTLPVLTLLSTPATTLMRLLQIIGTLSYKYFFSCKCQAEVNHPCLNTLPPPNNMNTRNPPSLPILSPPKKMNTRNHTRSLITAEVNPPSPLPLSPPKKSSLSPPSL